MRKCQFIFYLTVCIHSSVAFRITDINDKHWQALESNMVEEGPDIASDKKKRYGEPSTLSKIGRFIFDFCTVSNTLRYRIAV